MSTKKLVLLILVAGGLVGLYQVGAPPAAGGVAADSSLKARLLAVPGRLGHGLGLVTSKVVSPAVRKTVDETERDLELLRRDLRTAQTTVAGLANAREAVRRIAVMDSTALADLAAGRPVKAFKLAIQANGLVAGVQDNLRGD
jgi:hypothetical protein